MDKTFDKCFIDIDSVIYRIALKDVPWATARRYYDNEIENIEWITGCDKAQVALKGKGNFRYDIAEDYKGQRKVADKGEDPRPEVTKRRKKLNEYAYSLGHFKSDNCEADDVVSIWATEALEAGDNYVIAHIDKDIDMVEGWHYNFSKKNFYYISEDEGYYKMCVQMLTGDATDNIQGLKNVGPKTAAKLLDVPKEEMFSVVKATWKERHPEDWEEKLEVCWNLIYMRRDWDSFRRLKLSEVFTDED